MTPEHLVPCDACGKAVEPGGPCLHCQMAVGNAASARRPPEPPPVAALLRHAVVWDPGGLSAVDRWTCPCRATLLRSGSNVYGTATERPCALAIEREPDLQIRYRMRSPRVQCYNSGGLVWALKRSFIAINGVIHAPCPACNGCAVRVYREGGTEGLGPWRFTVHRRREPIDEQEYDK